MASTISAGTTTTTALVYSADTSGVLQLQTNGGTTALTLDTSQNATFAGKVASASSLQLATNGTTTAVIIDTSQRVLIGTTSGSYGLVVGTGATDIRAQINGSTQYQLQLVNGSNSGFWIGSPSADAMAFSRGDGVERARFDSSGNFGLGVTPSGWSGRTAFQFGAAGQLNYGSATPNGGSSGYGNNGYWNGSADKAITTGYSQIVALNDNGTGRVIILTTSGTSSAGASISYTAGPYVAAGGVSWTNSSDERLKNITGEIQNGLSKVCSLRAAEFTWKDDTSNKPQVGLIAQDVQAVLPEVISLTTKYNSEDKTEYLGVSYTETIPLLVAAIKELSAQVTTLQTQVTALKG